jgi:hypothetical protein
MKTSGKKELIITVSAQQQLKAQILSSRGLAIIHKRKELSLARGRLDSKVVFQ